MKESTNQGSAPGAAGSRGCLPTPSARATGDTCWCQRSQSACTARPAIPVALLHALTPTSRPDDESGGSPAPGPPHAPASAGDRMVSELIAGTARASTWTRARGDPEASSGRVGRGWLCAPRRNPGHPVHRRGSPARQRPRSCPGKAEFQERTCQWKSQASGKWGSGMR